MTILTIVIIAFMILELLNVALLYSAPESVRGNSLGYFKAFQLSESNPEVHRLIRYLVNWVAGTKVIFIALLVVILIFGSFTILLWSAAALILSISLFYWRMYPAIKRMDEQDELTQKGYSRTLGIMIACFIAVFASALILALILL